MAHLTIVTKRLPMTQWPIQRNVYTLIPQTNTTMKQESPHILTAHNTNTPRLSTIINSYTVQQQQQQQNSSAYDDSLTNLSWLHDMNILKRTMPPINSSSNLTNKRKDQSSVSNSIYPNDISDAADSILTNDDNDEQWKMYRTNPHTKPVYSYSQLILLAMKQSGYEKMTLQMIYEWVAENFPYFKKMEPTWQNSIRHNLSSNKCFIKVARAKKETGNGKGGFWKLSPDYEKQRLINTSSQSQQQDLNNSPQIKRLRHSKRSTLNEIITNNSTSLIKPSSISYENIKNESWIDPILQSFGSKTQSPLHCQTTLDNHSYSQISNSYLSPTSSPDSLTISSLTSHPINDLSSLLTPSPSTSPSSLSSSAKANLSHTKLDESDMLLLDSSTFDFDAYLYETATNDIDVQPLLAIKSEHDLYNDFHAALTDLTSSAEAAAAIGADTNTFDAFDYSSKHSTFNCLFDDDDQHQQQQQTSLDNSNYSTDLSIKGCGIKRPQWWSTHDPHSSTKLPSLETAFDLKLSK